LSGTAYAAATIVLPKNSVGSKQLKRNAVINSKIEASAVTGRTATESIVASSPGVTILPEGGFGFPRLSMPRNVNNCTIVATTSSGIGTQTIRNSTTTSGTLVQLAIHDDAGTSVRSDFSVVVLC
jgi:hypothetical protein